jgi:PAS domain S-box-containing protein
MVDRKRPGVMTNPTTIAVESLPVGTNNATDRDAAEPGDERRFRALIEQIPAITYTESKDAWGVIDFISPQVETILGYSPQEVVGQPGFIEVRIHPDDRLPNRREAERTFQSGEPYRMEYRIRASDGRWVWLRDETLLIRDEEGTPLYRQGILVDVTERKEAEAALRESEARFRAVLESAPVGIVVQDAVNAIVVANDAAARTLGLTHDELHGRTSLDPRWAAVHEDGTPFPDDEHPAVVSLRTGEACSRVVMGVHRPDGSLVWLEVNSEPLKENGAAAPYPVVVTFVDLTERFALEAALRKSEQRFRLLVQDGYDVITVVDREGRRRYVSPGVTRSLGYEPRELEGESALDLVHPDDAPRLAVAIADCLAGARRTAPLDMRFRHRDGEWRDFEVVATNLLDEPAVAGIVFNSRDVTDRKAAEAALRENEARFRTMFEGAGIATALADANGTIVLANPALGAFLGYQPAELVGMNVQALTHPEDDIAQQELRRRMGYGELDSYELEKRYLRRDGTVVWGHLHTVAIRDADGNLVASLGQVQDITSRKAAEEALRESEAQLQTLARHVPVALYRHELTGDRATTYVSPRWASLLGLREEDVPIGLPALLDRMHPDDREPALRAAELAERDGAPFDVEYRLRHDGGHWVWIRDHSHVERDEQGRPIAWTGVLVDVTERKRLTASLRESQERFRRAFEDAPIGISIGDANGICLDANTAYCRILGRTCEEVVGHPFAEFAHPDDAEVYDRHHARLSLGEIPAYQIEKRYLRPDGAVVTGLLTCSLVRDEMGNTLYDIGQLQDITERKELEAALRERETQLGSIVAQLPAAIYRFAAAPASRYTFASAHFEAMVGFPIGPEGVTLEDYFARVHPDDVAAVRAADAAAEAAGAPFDVQYRLRSRDGTWVWVHDRSTPERDERGAIVAWYGVLLDISDEKRLEALARETEARFRAAFDHAPIGLALITPDGWMREVNFALGDLLGYGETELLNMTFDALIHPDDVPDLLEQVEHMWVNGPGTYKFDARCLHREGHTVWTRSTVSVVRDEDGAIYAIAQVQDTTDQRQLEMERAIMLASEREYARQLRLLTEMRTDLMAMVAHELRTPIAAARIMVSMLATKELPLAEEAKTFAAIFGQIDQLDRLVSDFANAAAAERDNFSVQLHAVPLRVLMGGAAAYAETGLTEHAFMMDPVPAVNVWCDPERIGQVLQNLLGNAAKHTPPGTTVTLRAERDGDWVTIEVADTGPGIPPEDLPLIFEKFGRGRQTTDREMPGTGLGLYLSRGIVEAHGSALTLESAPGRGAVFGLALRIAP